jgi:hypothetical protein
MNGIGHTPTRLKRAGVGTNGILECKFLVGKKEPYPEDIAARMVATAALIATQCWQSAPVSFLATW